jgi:site-specific recombinase XerD
VETDMRRPVHEWKQFLQDHPAVEAWLEGRPDNTKRKFAGELISFSSYIGMAPEAWRDLDKFEARDLAWKYVQTKTAENPAVANVAMVTLKSFYRNKNGELLPFDSARGGKHHFRMRHKKAEIEHIPSKKEMYQIIDMAGNLRDKSMLLFSFQSGVRENAAQHIRLKHILDQLDRDTITLKITPDLDFKLRGREIPFYYTFLNGEGAETLKRYVAVAHKNRDPEAYLFYTKSNRPMSQSFILRAFKNCVRKAGLDAESMWVHSIRKAFRKVVRQADIDDDDKEQLMGHMLKGSRQAYYDNKDVDMILATYRKCNFSRETITKNELEKLREQLVSERAERAATEERVTTLEAKLLDIQKTLKAMVKTRS